MRSAGRSVVMDDDGRASPLPLLGASLAYTMSRAVAFAHRPRGSLRRPKNPRSETATCKVWRLQHEAFSSLPGCRGAAYGTAALCPVQGEGAERSRDPVRLGGERPEASGQPVRSE